ncbi:uncharacterized protein LOC131941019 [Physella acuta]|uniref:uncharacterized protein LOC131941019 n=1 Tax=Physella acuta TaxID=109671 RepID=UPI0027DD0BD9|nr:uncharacterized protein LOC131941019 [Physella acuta]
MMPSHTIVFVYMLININIVVYCIPMCNVCGENTECVINRTYVQSDQPYVHLVWSRNSTPITECFINGEYVCKVYPQYRHNVATDIFFEADRFHFSIKLVNLSRNLSSILSSEGVWELFEQKNNSEKQLQYSCMLNIYSQLNIDSCYYKPKKEGLLISCTTTPSYPKSICKFQARLNAYPINELQSTAYHYTTVKTNPIYYKTECFVLIPTLDLLPGMYEYDVEIFQAIGEVNEINKIAIKNKTLIIEFPKIDFENCPKTITKGQYIHCVCKKTDDSQVNTTLAWYINNTVHTSTSLQRAVLLSIQVYYNNSEFVCAATNDFGWKVVEKYKPITREDNSINCVQEKPNICGRNCYTNEEFCHHEKVYHCQNASDVIENIQEWCKTQPNLCNKLCISLNKTTYYKGNSNSIDEKTILFLVITVFLVICLGVLIGCCLNRRRCFRSTKKQENMNVNGSNGDSQDQPLENTSINNSTQNARKKNVADENGSEDEYSEKGSLLEGNLQDSQQNGHVKSDKSTSLNTKRFITSNNNKRIPVLQKFQEYSQDTKDRSASSTSQDAYPEKSESSKDCESS